MERGSEEKRGREDVERGGVEEKRCKRKGRGRGR